MTWRDWNYGESDAILEIVSFKDPDKTPEQVEQGFFNEDYNLLMNDVNAAYLEFVRERRRFRAEVEDQKLYGVR